MDKSRVFRCLICLLLVCCLVFSMATVPVRATSTGTFIGVAVDQAAFYAQAGALGAGASVFFYVALGLGVVLKAADTVKTLNEYMEYSGEMDVSIYYYPDGTWSYGIDMGFIERVRTFFFEKGVLVQTDDVVLDPDVEIPADALALARSARYAALAYYTRSGNGPLFNIAYSNESPVYIEPTSSDGTGMKTYLADNTATGYIWSSWGEYSQFTGTGSVGNASHVIISSYKFGTAFTHVDITIEDAKIEHVAPMTVPLPDGYPEWHSNSQTATRTDTDEETVIFPIPFNPSTDIGTLPNGVTQNQVWQGSIADPMPDSGGDSGSQPNPDGSNAVMEFFVDLAQFFPFCIPYDIYKFFEYLVAEPVAPVFHWEIQDLAGNVYEIDIDLSPWDSFAALFRDMQLILYIFGLMMLTRKFIKW